MQTRKMLFISVVAMILLIAVFAFGKPFIRTKSIATQSTQSPEYVSPTLNVQRQAKEVNEIYARQGTDGEKEKGVAKLFDAIFRFANTRHMPEEVLSGIKERMVSAELSYREGKQPPITESSVVTTLNSKVTEFGFPEWTKTFVAQLRVSRVALRREIPDLIGIVSLGNNKDMPTEMSPAEVTLVILDLYVQKNVNDLFQSTPEEFAVKMNQGKVNAQNQANNNTKQALTTDNTRTEEFENKIADLKSSGKLNMMNSSLINSLNDFFTSLGFQEVKK